jgi:xylan 1,4-beta-xylosidase
MPQTIAYGETRYLSTEVAGGFTGVYFGLYATGNGQPSTTPAYFDYIEYAPLDD